MTIKSEWALVRFDTSEGETTIGPSSESRPLSRTP